MTYARFYRKMTREEKSPTLLRRGEKNGRSGGVFGTVFAQKSNHEATKGAKEEEEIETADGRR